MVGASDDFIVDDQANRETALYFGLDEPVVVDSPHDAMLGRNWSNSAEVINSWIRREVLSS